MRPAKWRATRAARVADHRQQRSGALAGGLAEKTLLARVLPVADVMAQCADLGFGVGEIFALCGPFSAEFNAAFYRQCRADVVITKASGAEGGYQEKVQPCLDAGIPCIVITRPAAAVSGEELLARMPFRSAARWLAALEEKNMKKALLVVSFGTSYHDTCEKNIVACERELAASCPDRTLFRAFTSGMIIRKLKQRDNPHRYPLQALQKLAEQGYQDVAIQSLHIINGDEYEKIVREVQSLRPLFSA
jgi:hypothetical protein